MLELTGFMNFGNSPMRFGEGLTANLHVKGERIFFVIARRRGASPKYPMLAQGAQICAQSTSIPPLPHIATFHEFELVVNRSTPRGALVIGNKNFISWVSEPDGLVFTDFFGNEATLLNDGKWDEKVSDDDCVFEALLQKCGEFMDWLVAELERVGKTENVSQALSLIDNKDISEMPIWLRQIPTFDEKWTQYTHDNKMLFAIAEGEGDQNA